LFDAAPIITWNARSGAFRRVTTELLREVYLLPPAAPFDLAGELASGTWPWSESLECAPSETMAAVGTAFRQFVEATATLGPEEVDLSHLDPDSRLHAHASALLGLWRALGGALPPDRAVWHGVLEADAEDAIEALPIVTDCPPREAPSAYRALYRKLVADHGRASGSARAEWARRQQPLTEGAPPDSSLGHAQHNLLDPAAGARPLDGSMRFLSLRDFAEEAACAAALVQATITQGDGASARDFGLLIPDDPVFCAHLQAAFNNRGIALSGLPAPTTSVDVACETLLNFLLSLRRPAPAMALASLYVSPLMPWDADTGRAMAGAVMDGKFDYRGAKHFPDAQRRLYQLLRKAEIPDNRALRRALKTLGRALQREGDCAGAARQLDERIGRMRAMLAAAPKAPPDWEDLANHAAPGSARNPRQTRYVDGVAVFSETALPWRPVKHLIVMGFAAGAWPRPAAGNPFFLDSELQTLRDRAGLHIPTRAEVLDARLGMFREQLCAATKSATFLCPERDGAGTALGRPTALALIARTIEGGEDYETLPVPLDQLLEGDPIFPIRQVKPLRDGGQLLPPFVTEIELRRDLLRLRPADDGSMLRQSPSRLETLLVSPLVWVLNELGAEPSIWAPEEFDIRLKGNLAHDVFENLFLPEQDLPEPDNIAETVRRLCDRAIRRAAPFLQSSLWRIERQRFVREVSDAALAWRTSLADLQAEIVVNEVRLGGEAHGILINGRADCILRLKSGQLLIVDHKKSASGKRRERMLAGWDLQLALYRGMLLRPDFKNQEVRALLSDEPDIAVAYHTMNDGAVLCHGLHASGQPTGNIEVIESDVSAEALARLQTRLAEVGVGIVRLNSEDDEAFFTKTAKLIPYALADSFLANVFSVPAKRRGLPE
jgi:RecB family exonuclease